MRIALAAILALMISASAHADLVANWTFEINTPGDLSNSTTIGGIAADAGSGTASGLHASAATDWSTPAGNGSDNSLSSNTFAIGDYYQYVVNTVGITGLTLSFDQTGSGTGPRDWTIQTSTNGTTFTDLLNYTVLENGASPNLTWSVASGVQAAYRTTTALPVSLEGLASAYIRFAVRTTTSTNGGAVGAAGTSRMDNVLFESAVIPEPSAFMFGILVCLVAGFAKLKCARPQ